MLKQWIKIAGIMILAMMASQAKASEKMIQVKGSDTMVHLASAWAEAFMKENPGIEIAVTGGGSGTGISALLNGTADIANSSRPIANAEIKAAKAKGWIPMEHIVALDGIAVIVNPANPIKKLTMAQVRQIFSGEKNNWKVFGGSKQKIILFTRDSSSGTFAFFQEHVLNKGDYSVKARRLASNAAIVQSVAEDTAGIGYVGMGYITEARGKVKVLAIAKDDKSSSIAPSVTSVKDGSYSISRGLQMYTKGQEAGAVKKYMDFILNAMGQKIVEDMGFVSMK